MAQESGFWSMVGETGGVGRGCLEAEVVDAVTPFLVQYS